MQASLKEIVGGILSVSGQVSEGSVQISATAQEMSQGAASRRPAPKRYRAPSRRRPRRYAEYGQRHGDGRDRLKTAKDAEEGGKAVEESVAATSTS